MLPPSIIEAIREKFRQFFGHCPAKFLSVDYRQRPTIIARDVVADTDRNEFDRGSQFHVFDFLTQMALKIVPGIDGKR